MTVLNAAGLPAKQTPKCVEEREAFLQTAPFVIVVVSTRTPTDSLARCLSAMLALRYPRYEVIVVDDGSSDQTFGQYESEKR